MELSILIFAAVVLLVLFVCSISNVVHQLPDSPIATRKAINRNLVEIGYFLNFKTNTKILIDSIYQLQEGIEELGNENYHQWREWQLVVEKGIQMSDEAGKIIDKWNRRWSSSCYRLGIEVGDMILEIDEILEGPYFLYMKPAMSRDSIRYTIVLVFLLFFAYSFSNLVLLLQYYGRAARDAIVEYITVSLNLEKKLNILRIKINSRSPTKAVKEEAELLIDEAEHVINHWYRGWWTGSRYKLSKRVAGMIFGLGPQMVVHGISARDVISRIDEIHHIVPRAISDIHHYLNFDANIETLRKIQVVNDPPPNPYNSEEENREFLALVEAARMEATQLVQEAEAMDRYWFRRWPGSRYSLSKRVVKMVADFQEVVAAQFSGEEDVSIQLLRWSGSWRLRLEVSYS